MCTAYGTLRECAVSCAPRGCAVTGTHRRRAQRLGLARHKTDGWRARREYEPYKARCEARRVGVSVKTSRVSVASRSSGITLTVQPCGILLAAGQFRIRLSPQIRAASGAPCANGPTCLGAVRAHMCVPYRARAAHARRLDKVRHMCRPSVLGTRPAHAAEPTTMRLAIEPHQACV